MGLAASGAGGVLVGTFAGATLESSLETQTIDEMVAAMEESSSSSSSEGAAARCCDRHCSYPTLGGVIGGTGGIRIYEIEKQTTGHGLRE